MTKAFVEAIDRRDSQVLKRDFGISSAVLDEIYDSIDSYFEQGKKLSLAPEEKAFEAREGQRPFIDAYETNDQTLGLECVIFADGYPAEAIIHLEIAVCDGRLSIFHRYIGS